jgi:energy-coupling factor transporter ATP-binding protein EcfA2
MGQIIILENPAYRLDLIPQKKFKQLFIEAPRQGARQVILLTTDAQV